MSEIEENIELCRQAVEENPGDVDALNFLGIAYWATEQYGDAIEVFTMIVEIDPDLAGAWYNLGCVYKNTGQTDKVNVVHGRLKNLDEELADDFFKTVMKR